MTVRILHVLDHSIPMQSGYTFRTRAILREQRRMGWETFHLTSPKHTASTNPAIAPSTTDAASCDDAGRPVGCSTEPERTGAPVRPPRRPPDAHQGAF